jgi:hypothetical protein
MMWSYAFLSLIGMITSVFLGSDRWPGWILAGWLLVAFLACWGMGWSLKNLINQFKLEREGTPQKKSEVWLWLAASAGALLVSCLKLGSLPTRLFPAVALLVAAIALLKQTGLAAGIIRGAGAGMFPLLGWAAVRQSIFLGSDGPAWFLAGFLFLWLLGCELAQKGLEQKNEKADSSPSNLMDGARIAQMLSIAPLFFLGQMKSMGVVYGAVLFILFVISENQHRLLHRKNGLYTSQLLIRTNDWIGLLVVLGCFFGRLV